MITESEAPAGAGLAGSSTLNIACIGALNRLVGNRYAPEKFIPIAANDRMSGYQSSDRLSGLLFGAIRRRRRDSFSSRTEWSAKRWKLTPKRSKARIVVIYTGEPRNSGTNNWEITKRHIDGDREIFDIFEGIRDTSMKFAPRLCWKAIGTRSAKF